MKILEIYKDDLKYNLDKIKEIAKENSVQNKTPKLIGVVKSNGMGLGLEEYARFLVENNVEILAVSNSEEAIILREIGIAQEIILLSPIEEKEELKKLIEKNITLTIGSLSNLTQIEELLENNEDNLKVKAHLKIDTGFGRYGVIFTNIEEILKIFKNSKNVEIVGTYTHFSKPMDKNWTRLQFDRYMDIIEKIKRENLNPGILHCCSSTAFFRYPEMYLDAVRIGSAIQGRTLVRKKEFKKIGVFKTNIVQIKQLPKGYFISYNNAYKTKKDTKIAILPVGYMDGLNRNKLRDDFSLKNNIIAVFMEFKKIFKDNSLKVFINGKSYSIIGKLGMYHSIVDITGEDNVKVGDTAILEISPLQTNEKIRREYV